MPTVFASRLHRHASNRRTAPAMAWPGRTIDYAELTERVQACATWLARQGCSASELVGITVADELSHMVASLALLWLGVPQICLPTRDPASLRLGLADRLGVGRVVVTDAAHALGGRPALRLTPEVLASFVRGGAPSPIDADPDAPAVYLTSSGTTGDPKVFALSQTALAWRSERRAESEHAPDGCRALTPLSVEESPAKTQRLYLLHAGFTCVFQDASGTAPLSLQALCRRLDVSCLEIGALHASDLARGSAETLPLPDAVTVYASGSRIPLGLRRDFRSRVGVPLFVHYGAREFGRIATTFPAGDAGDVETVGRPCPWIELEIVDGDGAVLPPGETGEIRVRSEHMAPGYVDDPIATARHFREGWFCTGDLGSLTPDGALCVLGRGDEVMNLNSIKISPAEIERVLEEHPAVKAAAAFARRSAVHGDIPIAAVELHESARVAVDDLMACARERLGVRAPRKIVVLDALPRSATGKVLKAELLERVAPGT